MWTRPHGHATSPRVVLSPTPPQQSFPRNNPLYPFGPTLNTASEIFIPFCVCMKPVIRDMAAHLLPRVLRELCVGIFLPHF